LFACGSSESLQFPHFSQSAGNKEAISRFTNIWEKGFQGADDPQEELQDGIRFDMMAHEHNVEAQRVRQRFQGKVMEFAECEV